MLRSSLRSATLNGYVGLADSLGLDTVALLRSAGLDPADLAVPDRWISAAATALLLERSAAEASAPDFALRLAELRRLSTLGPLSVVLREEPDLRGVLNLLLRYESTYNEALRMRLSEENGLATVRMSLELGELVPTGQALELAVAALHGIIRESVGSDWRPLSVCFSHAAQGDLAAHHRVFGQRVRFGHGFTGLVFSARDLDARNALADPLLRPYAQQLLASIASPRVTGTADRVRETMEVLLPLGRCSMDLIARTLGVDRRTLHRHLATEGETFSGLLHETRGRLAGRHLANDRYAMIEVADLLGFSTPSAFTRWFTQQFGMSPREWRRTSGGAAPRPTD
jgi:AraC-like DNA-binding protein